MSLQVKSKWTTRQAPFYNRFEHEHEPNFQDFIQFDNQNLIIYLLNSCSAQTVNIVPGIDESFMCIGEKSNINKKKCRNII